MKKVNKDQIKLLFIGRLDRQKGIDLLISTLRRNNTDGRFDLRIIGDSVLDSSISVASDSHMKFLGWQDSQVVSEEIDKTDIVVIPSRWEGFGLVSLEAMRAKKMVLASSAGALSEIVVDRQTGLVFTANSENSMNRSLNIIRKMSYDDIKKFGLAGYDRFKSVFGYQQMANKVMALYSSIV